MIIFNDDCEWGWEDWVGSYIHAVLEHANIKAIDIFAEDMDEDNIYFRATELDTASKKHIENEYCIHYVDDAESMVGLTFFYTLFQREEDGYLYLKNYGGYKVVRYDGGCHCISLGDLTN